MGLCRVYLPSNSCTLPAQEAIFEVFLAFWHSKALKGNVHKPLLKLKTMRKWSPTSVRKEGRKVSLKFCCFLFAYESLLQWVVKFRACSCQSSAILVHSWGIYFYILARFTQCWGSLEASRQGMLEVIAAVGSRSGLCWRRCCCYLTCFAAILVHLAAFSLPFDLGMWCFV